MRIDSRKFYILLAKIGMNKIAFCRYAKIHPVTLRDAMHGTAATRPSTIKKIADALGVSAAEILEDVR